jgi:hypothetical protein
LRRLGGFDVTDGICFWGNRKISKKMRDPKFKERQGNGTNLTRGVEAGRSVLDRRRINACPMIECHDRHGMQLKCRQCRSSMAWRVEETDVVRQ